MFGQVGQTGPLFGYFKDFYYLKDYFLFIQILELQEVIKTYINLL